MSLFQRSVLDKYLKQQDGARMAKGYEAFKAHFHDAAIQANIRDSKEEQYQEGFLRDLFVRVLGYTLNPQAGYDLTTELKNEKGSKKADGAILADGKAIAVIELKGTDTTDLGTINTQAFNYKANQSQCVYVVTSNFEKLRFFIDNAVEWIDFDLFTLNEEQFRLLWLCLHRDSLFAGIPKKVKTDSVQEEENITKKLYSDYSAFKNALWQDLVKSHPEHDQLLLFKKTQKLLDRFLFVLFSEDKGLLPPNSIREIADQWEKLRDMDAYVPLYARFQKYFGYLNTGHKGKLHDIFAYNGGLFKPDEVLDAVRISDEVLHPHLMRISKYDFASEVDVNILGHIFEHSLNEIEAITAQLEGRVVDSKKTKRKKDGVFYTPKYITKYIVENTVGRLCAEKKDELAINDEEYARGRKGRQKKTIEMLDTKLDVYRDWLLSLTICDPACGSGAFLNQALDFLIAEHAYVNELEAKLLGQSIVFKDIGDHILERNIYGVDINEESVEIARLSLWLRTATKGRKLNDLSGNIKCGNSLIDDPAVAGAKAFDWKKEFPAVFAKGGFDVVIGNPPYVLVFDEKLKEHLEEVFPVFKRNNDLYACFVEQSTRIVKKAGALGLITPNSYVKGEYFGPLRELLAQYQIGAIVDFTQTLVFEDANVFSAVLDLRKSKPSKTWFLRSDLDTVKGELQPGVSEFTVADPIFKRLRRLPTFESLFFIKDVGFNYWSEGRGKVRGGSIGDRVLYEGVQEHPSDVPYVKGSNFNRYTDITYNNFLRHDYESRLVPGDTFRFTPKFLTAHPKVIYRQTSSKLIGTLDRVGYHTDKTVHSITNRDGVDVNPAALLAIFNSKLLNYFYTRLTEEAGRAFAQVKTVNIKPLPFPSQLKSDRLVALTKDIMRVAEDEARSRRSFLDLLRSKYTLPTLSRALENWPGLEFKGFLAELKKAKVQLTLAEEAEWLGYFTTEKAKAQGLDAEIKRTDKEIDALVYRLYGLSAEEIAVVEGK